jgi:ADP-heptose:LPS heptosyltransferase
MRNLVISPISNDPLRDWPLDHFKEFIKLCLEQLDCHIALIGTKEQRTQTLYLTRGFEAARVKCLAGHFKWPEILSLIAAADCVVTNNSGVGHASARLGVATVCVFGASHLPFEWMPRGRNVRTMVKQTVCAPCGNSGTNGCPFAKRCLREVPPTAVFASVCDAIASA